MTRFHRSAAQRADWAGRPQQSERLASWYTPGFSDALGDRLLMFDNTTASSLELLRFRPEFGAAPGFEDALRSRVAELAGFTHPAVARIRTVESLGEDDGLALISNHVAGRRLSEILQDARGPQFATELVRQLAPVLAALQEQGTAIAHGLVTPERVIVTPEGRLVLVEHVLGSAFDALRLPAARLQSELGLAVPPGARHATLDQRADVIQLGYLALSLLVGRQIGSAGSAAEIFGLLDRQALTPGGAAPKYLHEWLLRALQVDARSFGTAGDAADALANWPDRELDRDEDAPALDMPDAALTPITQPARPSPPEPKAPAAIEITTGARDRTLDVPVTAPPPAAPPARPEPPRPEPPAPNAAPVDVKSEPASDPVPAAAAQPSVPMPAMDPPALPAPMPMASPISAFMENPVARWAVAGLALVAIVEALVIAGLLNTRPADSPPPAAVSEAASASAPAPAPPATATATAPTAPATPAAAPPSTGRLEVTSDPAGASVTIGGRAAGRTPLSVSLPPGRHAVVITTAGNTTRRTVNVTAGGSATLMASLAPAGPTAGWLSVETPLDLQVYEGSTLLGTTRADRLMLPAGRHNLRLSSAALAWETMLDVDVRAGETVRARVPTPNGSLSLNALPWANVSIDGQPAGTTPIANLVMPIGTHEVVWQHPQFGERRQTIVVTARNPVRLVIDLRQ